MITVNTVNKLIDNYESIMSMTRDLGWDNLRVCYAGGDEETISLIVTDRMDETSKAFSLEELREKLTSILEIPVSLVPEGSPAGRFLVKTSRAPLSDMEASINYFFDYWISESDDKCHPSEIARQLALTRWADRNKVIDLSSSKEEPLPAGFPKRLYSQVSPSFFPSPPVDQLLPEFAALFERVLPLIIENPQQGELLLQKMRAALDEQKASLHSAKG